MKKYDSPKREGQNSHKADMLMREAEEYFRMARDYRDQKFRIIEHELNVIDRKWLKKWKEYTNYPLIKKKLTLEYYRNKINTIEVNDSLHPGKIDNSRILIPLNQFLNNGYPLDQANIIIRHDLSQKDDVKIVSKKIWEFFHHRYGGGPPIIRGVITEDRRFETKKLVELFSRTVNILLLPQRKIFSRDLISNLSPHKIYISRTQNLHALKQKIADLVSLPNLRSHFPFLNRFDSPSLSMNSLRLWKIKSSSSLQEFKEYLSESINILVNGNLAMNVEKVLVYLEDIPNIPLQDLEFADTDICIVEIFDEVRSPGMFEIKKQETKDGRCDYCHERKALKYFCTCNRVGYCSQMCRERDRDLHFHASMCTKSIHVQDDGIKLSSYSRKGLVGLQNLGNTCFMNTSLQCLSNCTELTEYFLHDYYKAHINENNPIGTHGLLASSYANLLKNLWYGSDSTYSPWNFKSAISSFQSMFTGYQQHDTHEFLNYLLDGLHEDLNKVKKKPIVNMDESEKEDKIKSTEQWISFLRRNQSLLVDLFYGQYKSTLYCPNPKCENVSTTFDPFLSVSLPIANRNVERYDITCFFIFYDISITSLQLTLQFKGDISTICVRNKISKILDVHPFSFVVVKLKETGELENLVGSSVKVKSTRLATGRIIFFCFQIDPQIFENPASHRDVFQWKEGREYKQTFETLNKRRDEIKAYYMEDYKEDEKGETQSRLIYYSYFNVKTVAGQIKKAQIKIDDDFNNGLDDGYMRVVMFLKKYDEANPLLRKRLVFPRVLYIHKMMSTKRLHNVIVLYFGNILKSQHNLKENDNISDMFFPDYEDFRIRFNEITFEQQRIKAYPFVIRIEENISAALKFCICCQDKNCNGCLLPYSDDITIQDLLNHIPKNEDMEIDNSYYYLNDSQKKFIGIPNRDFSIDVTWLPQYIGSIRKLNDKTDFNIAVVPRLVRSESSIDISSCFESFITVEKLLSGNEWYCSKCKAHQLASKKMEIYKAPLILIIHLKRFRNNCKIETLVEFPITGLDISSYVINNPDGQSLLYNLFAIANHYGGLGGGHYVAFGKNQADDAWYSFNDSSVSTISPDSLVTNGAYVLFYKRRCLSKLINLEELYTKPFIDYEGRDEDKTDMSTDDI